MKENRKEKTIETSIKNEKLKLSDFTKLFNPKIETAAKVGIDNRKDIFTEAKIPFLIFLKLSCLQAYF